MDRKLSSLLITVALLALMASSCKPDLTASRAAVHWDNNQQSASFTLENNGQTAAGPFHIQILLLENRASDPKASYAWSIPGLAAGEKLEVNNLSLRHLLGKENDCLSRVSEAVLVIDQENTVEESNEANNRCAVRVPYIQVPCEGIVRFEDLPSEVEFLPISHIASDGAHFAIRPLDGKHGFATVRQNMAIGHRQVLWLNDVWLQAKLSTPVYYLSFDIGSAGGPLYLEVNGDTALVHSLSNLDGLTIGGVSACVSGSADNIGAWHFEGTINSLKVGGQELAIDNMIFWSPQTDDYETSHRSIICPYGP